MDCPKCGAISSTLISEAQSNCGAKLQEVPQPPMNQDAQSQEPLSYRYISEIDLTSDASDKNSSTDIVPSFFQAYWHNSYPPPPCMLWNFYGNFPIISNSHLKGFSMADTEERSNQELIEAYRKVAQVFDDHIKDFEQDGQVAKLKRITRRKLNDSMSINHPRHSPKLLNMKPNNYLRGMQQIKQPCQRRNMMTSRSQRHSKSK